MLPFTILAYVAPATVGVHGPQFIVNASTHIKTAPVGKAPKGFAEESYDGYEGTISGSGTSLTVQGNVRTYWVKDVNQHSWSSIDYNTLNLAGKSLSFTADYSRVGCGCNAALYLVAMPSKGHGNNSGYCDIQAGSNACLEIDLLEGNTKAIQTTLHTQTGQGADGTCNRYGCAVNWGKSSQELYGRGSMIDSSRSYDVDAAFDADGCVRCPAPILLSPLRSLRALLSPPYVRSSLLPTCAPLSSLRAPLSPLCSSLRAPHLSSLCARPFLLPLSARGDRDLVLGQPHDREAAPGWHVA